MDRKWGASWDKISVTETRNSPELVGTDLATLSIERGVHPADVMFDIAVEDDLVTRFTIILANDDEEQLAELLSHPRALIGLSDAGAHLGQLCDACFAPYLLEYWVREKGVLPIETAIWKLTGEPADYLGLSGRGRLEVGSYADVVVFNPSTVGVSPMRRISDLPGGAERVVIDATGIQEVLVNGVRILTDGQPVSGAELPGRVVRPEEALS